MINKLFSQPNFGAFPRLIAQSDPRSMAAEAYRTLRTNLQFAGLDEPCRNLLVTSARPGAGKTTTVANLGVVVAQAGSKVCLIDSDLRRPTLQRLFGLDQKLGLTTALLEELPFAAVAQPTRIPNLSVVTSGTVPPNPSELVGSKRMHDLLKTATSSFDLVILDSPPVISVSDALALSALCDGVILVVCAGGSPHEIVRRAAEQIKAVRGRILGVILNGVDPSHDHHYYHYYREYRGDGDDPPL